MHNYPTDEQLKTIREFDLSTKPVKELIAFVQDIWEYGEQGFTVSEHKLELHTLGWSGNEDIIVALQENFMFWSMYWKSHRRGGHYEFDDDSVVDSLKGFV